MDVTYIVYFTKALLTMCIELSALPLVRLSVRYDVLQYCNRSIFVAASRSKS